MKKVSVVIPTLQKNIQLLNNLIDNLNADNSVSEIILIDNSTKGYKSSCSKLKVIVPKENLFVNPSWNLGVDKAQEEIVALLNDDVTIPNNFCYNVISKMNSNMGIIGFHRDFVFNTHEIMSAPELTELTLEKAKGRCGYFGIMMFFYKSSYVKIPDDMKIFWGDDWLYFQNKKAKRENYYISNQKIYHYDALSSGTKSANPYNKSDSKLYKKYTKKFWHYIFNYESVFRGFKITILGIDILHHFSKKH